MISLKNVSKFYYSRGTVASGFTKVSLDFKLGEFVAITGESGSGKSTLLNVISGLDSYEEGEMYVNGLETSHYTKKDWEDYRRKNIGNIFQNFNLINSYTVFQNIELVLLLNGNKKKDVKYKIIDLIKTVDLYKYRNTKVSKLSGGQKQRVAIARALAKDTPIIIADEPTGNLDKRSAEGIFKLLNKISKEKLVIIVTHNYEQVESYVTRKITMHDGRVIEDENIKDIESNGNVKINNYKNISLLNRIRLGIRNTFNIKVKFLLLLAVFLFMISAFFIEYSFFKEQEYLNSKQGENSFFADKNDKRVVINKKDKSTISKEEFDKINKINGVDYVIKNDLLIDRNIELNDNDNLWLYGQAYSMNIFKENVDFGRLPKSDNEVIVMGKKSEYYLSNMKDEIMDANLKIYNYNGLSENNKTYKIVGIKYAKDNEINNGNYKFFFNETEYDYLNKSINQEYSKTIVNFMNKELGDNYSIEINNNIKSGEAYISSDLNYLCKYNNCLNKPLTLNVSNLYYSDSINLTVTKSYNEDTIKNYLNIDNYKKSDYQYTYNNKIYVNNEDYQKLYNKDTYQSSIYVKDIKYLDSVNKSLKNMGFNTLLIKNTLVSNTFIEILKILKTIVTIVLLFTMFFISYFIIRIILKSRKNYYSIIRMLGGNVKTIKQLLIIELFNITNIAYFIVGAFVLMNYKKIIDIGVLNTIVKYFTLFDYIFVYIVLVIMSYLISIKFSRKLFVNTAMNTYMEDK